MLGDFTLALARGIVLQYFAIAPRRGVGLRKGLGQAAKADMLSLASFEIGLFAWMALMWFVFFPDPHLNPLSPVYWFFMQIGMIIGVRDRVAHQRVADPSRHQGAHVIGDAGMAPGYP